MIDALIALRCLQQVELDRFRPVVEMTELGTEVMKGKASVSGALPVPLDLLGKLRGEKQPTVAAPHVPLPSAADSSLPDPDPEIVEALRRWRGEIADEAGVPVFYILTNDTLTELARRQPKSREELLAIKGIGPIKAERYGRALLEILGEGDERGEEREKRGEGKAKGGGRKVEEEVNREQCAVGSGRSDPELRYELGGHAPSSECLSPLLSPLSPSSRPSHYWTWRLLSAGFSVEECAAIRGLSREVIEEHARRAEGELRES